MMKGHVERMLLAEHDRQAAQSYRAIAEEVVKMREKAVELHTAVDAHVPEEAQQALESARLELRQFNRICLRHAARRLDASLRAEGHQSEMESAVIFFDITHPVALAA